MINKYMTEIQAKYYYWGPVLFRTTIKSSHLKQLKNLCGKSSQDYRHTLAADIQEEYEINRFKAKEILEPYLFYFKHCYENWYNKVLPELKPKSAWVNYMKPGEHNPVHVHTECDFSSVVFIDIPKKLLEEIKQFKGTGDGPGALMFMYGEPHPYHVNMQSFTPVEGDMFMFPYSLRHTVSPFKSKCERVSVAINYEIKNESSK